MIKFACTCGEWLAFPEELAGSSSQCPNCHRLVEVPTLTELQGFADDGTIKFDETLHTPNPELDIALIPTRSDSDEVDRRPDYDDIDGIGVDEIPLAFKDELRPGAPKYDPETGELIRPIEFKPEEVPPDAIPVARAAPVSYARADLQPNLSPWRIAIELFMPANVIVMVVILVFHVLNQVIIMPVIALRFLIFFVGVGILMLSMIILSHYSNIVEEIGFQGKDEIPVPLRSVSLIEDVWWPFCHFAGAWIICFGPSAYLAIRLMDADPVSLIFQVASFPVAMIANPSPIMVVLGVMSLVGHFFFPAVWLTLCTSGSILNLRPDRVSGVIRVCGFAYLMIALLGTITAIVYTNALTMFTLNATVLFGVRRTPLPPLMGWPILLIAIYLGHWFAWCIGLLYRAHYDAFPWILQRHIPDPSKHRLPPRRPKARKPAPQAGSRAHPAPVTPTAVTTRKQELVQPVAVDDPLANLPEARPIQASRLVPRSAKQ